MSIELRNLTVSYRQHPALHHLSGTFAAGSLTAVVGPNGAGKSSVFDAVRLIRDLGTGDGLLGGTGDQDVPRLEFTKWLDSKIQEFELSLSVDGHAFDYILHLEQTTDYEKPRIIHEKATCDGKALFD